MYSAGIDIGSVATKGVIYNGAVAASVIIPTGWSPRDASRLALNMGFFFNQGRLKGGRAHLVFAAAPADRAEGGAIGADDHLGADFARR